MPSRSRSCARRRAGDALAHVVEQRAARRRCPRAPARSSRPTRWCPSSTVAEVGLGCAGQDPQQRGLAGAVEAHDQQPLAAADVEATRRRTRRARRSTWPGSSAVEHRATRRRAARGSARVSALRRRSGRRRASASSRATRLSRLCATRARLAVWPRIASASVCEPVDLLGSGAAASLAQALLVAVARREVLGVGALVLDHRAVPSSPPVEVEDAGDRLVEQVEVVADDEQRAAVARRNSSSQVLGVGVEVVGGLVEQQQRRCRRRGCGRARPGAARRRRARRAGGRARSSAQAEAGGELAHLGLGRVAAVDCELLLGPAEAARCCGSTGPPPSRGAASRAAPASSSSPRPESTWARAVVSSGTASRRGSWGR